ncbi:MAG: 1-acyl-sn-glycerol-3-phosphate acyltransferase [Leptolyngbya sp. BL-A-14]
MLTQPYRFGWFDWFCLWYPPGWLILFNRHWQHYKPNKDGWTWLEYGLFLLPLGFYLALLLRWVRFNVRSLLQGRSTRLPTNSDPDPDYQKAFQQEILTPIVHHYFRAELHQLEHLPANGPLLIVMNHAGMCFPWDFVSLGLLLSQQRDWFVQPLAHSIFFDHPWLRWWLPNGWAQMLGGVRAERQSFETAMHTGDPQKRILLYAPEGWRGLSKGWQQRYQLATFDPSFLRLSLRDRVPVLPVICIGSEYLHPLAANLPWLARRLGLPLFPLSPLVLAFVLFPSMGVWAMRSRLHFHVQPLQLPWEHTAHSAKQTQTRTYRMAAALRSSLQVVVNQLRQAKKEQTL